MGKRMWRKISNRAIVLKAETRSLRRSISCALFGIAISHKTQRSFRIQLFTSLIVLIIIGLLRTPPIEAAIIILCIASVLATELINTTIEMLCDLVSLKKSVKIKVIKDISAGAVLITSIASAAIGSILIIPRIAAIFY